MEHEEEFMNLFYYNNHETNCFVFLYLTNEKYKTLAAIILMLLRYPDNDRVVASSIASAFPTLAVNDTMNGILSLLLASLAYHYGP